MPSKKSIEQMKKVIQNQRTGQPTFASDVSDSDTQAMIKALNKEQARGTNTIASQANKNPNSKLKQADFNNGSTKNNRH